MRTNIKKVLAILLTVVMLFSLLPLGAMNIVSAAEPNLSLNWNDGTLGFDKGSVVTGGPDGSNCFKWSAAGGYSATYITVKNMDPAKDYVITFKAKASVAGNMGITIQNGDWGSYWNIQGGFNVTTSWKDVTLEMTAGSIPFTKGSILFKFQDTGTAMDLYIDDLVIAEKIEEVPETPAAGENLVINGDFENGTTGWSTDSTATVVSGGRSGSAIQLNNPSAWSEAARQDIAVEADTEYTLTWYAKRVSGSGVFNFEIAKAPYDGSKPTVTAIENQTWMNETSGNWVKYQVKIKTTDANGNGITSIMLKLTTEATNPGVLLMDDITLTKNATTSFDGFITNGDFEVGNISSWEAYHGSEASTAAKYTGSYGAHLKGNGSWGGIFSQGTVNVVAGKTYILSYDIKVVKNGINLQIKDGTTSSGTLLLTQKHTTAEHGSWTKVSLEITPTKNGFFINFCGIGSSGDANSSLAEEAYVDNIKVEEKPEAPAAGKEYIENGDFETGSNSPWTTYSGSAVSADAKYEGSYGLKLTGSGGWGGLAYQTINNLKKNQDYTITMWVKVVSGGANIQIKGADLNGDSIVSQYRSTTNSSSWTQITMTWTADATTGHINMCGDGTGTAAVVYVDSIVISRVGGEVHPEELHRFGGASIRENSDGSGLAFRFEIAAAGATRTSMNEYVANSGKMTIGDAQYNLVRMGAVMTNNASVGQSNTNFNLSAVNGTKVIDIEGKYLATLSEASVAFAVRIIDIPERHYGTEIYARPYFVYEEDGEEVVVYGDIQSDTYERVSNPKSSLKILSIGHSFSKDVMETYLWNMFKEGGYDEIVIGYLYMAGCSMPKHLYNIQNNLAQYEYGKNTNGTWKKTNNTAPLAALQDEDWDYVNIQSSPDYIGGQAISSFKLGVNNTGEQITLATPMTEYECIEPITAWIRENAINSSVKTDYNMIWSFSEDCELWSYTYHNYNQMTMYKNIVNITQEKVRYNDNINNVIPCATSIQNIRSSFMGDNFNMPVVPGTQADGYHLNDHGDYVAALTWYCHYSGDSASVMAGYTADFSEREFQAIAQAVDNAIRTPYAVTESTFKTE